MGLGEAQLTLSGPPLVLHRVGLRRGPVRCCLHRPLLPCTSPAPSLRLAGWPVAGVSCLVPIWLLVIVNEYDCMVLCTSSDIAVN